jgi:outer membrane immunogenic protein
MKKLYVLVFTFFAIYGAQAQGFGIGIGAGYLSEIEGFGGSADLIYEFDEHWGVSSTFTYSVADKEGVRAKWTIVDINARYKVYDELYLLAGGEYLSVDLKLLGLGGGNPIGAEQSFSTSDYGINAGAGYTYNLIDNVNVFAEVKYVLMEQGYLHGKLGLRFKF